jgi:hypothetical protein
MNLNDFFRRIVKYCLKSVNNFYGVFYDPLLLVASLAGDYNASLDLFNIGVASSQHLPLIIGNCIWEQPSTALAFESSINPRLNLITCSPAVSARQLIWICIFLVGINILPMPRNREPTANECTKSPLFLHFNVNSCWWSGQQHVAGKSRDKKVPGFVRYRSPWGLVESLGSLLEGGVA